MKKILCNLIVLSLLLCSCGKKESLVNNVGAKEKEVKKSEIVENKKNEIVESEDVVKLKSELAESQEALKKENEKTKEVQEALDEANYKVNFYLTLSGVVFATMTFGMYYYAVPINRILRIVCLPATILFGMRMMERLM